MTILEQKLAELKERLMTMAAIAQEMVSHSIQALVERDEALARRVIDVDEPHVNDLELEIEDQAIQIIALHQPEATDLRSLAMIIKVNNDLERIGDHAENIAEATLFLIRRPLVKPLIDLPVMSEESTGMLRDSLDAFTRSDPRLAREVCRRDSIVDDLKNAINQELAGCMAKDPATVERALKLMMISLNLERIADHATNISEDVIYMTTGEVIKHGRGKTSG
jgi:phosphate transport system protein